jgi:hypothetical protein
MNVRYFHQKRSYYLLNRGELKHSGEEALPQSILKLRSACDMKGRSGTRSSVDRAPVF